MSEKRSHLVTWLIFLKNPTFASPELRLARIASRPNCVSGVRGPFRCAQEDLFMGFSSGSEYAVLFAALKRTSLKIVMTRTTSFTLSCRFCHARRRRAAFKQKILTKIRKKSHKVKLK